ncbi:unnamed protein product [Durusdinium trenchii]|uniref:Uncharacterized protein n=1 Tax=Durusdinium trenchii TaxID=1381693 RepID=A0ABP0IBI9_9DINO
MSHGIKVSQAVVSKPAKSKRKNVTRSPFHGFGQPGAKEVRQLHRLLAKQFGERRPGKSKRQILDTVVGTILSQNTTNTNSHRAFSELKKRCLAPRDTTMAMVDLDHGPGKSSGKSADPCRCCCFWLLLLLLLLLLPLLVPVVSAGQWYIIV